MSYPLGVPVYLSATWVTFYFIRALIAGFKHNPIFLTVIFLTGIIPAWAGTILYYTWIGYPKALEWAKDEPKSGWEMWRRYLLGTLGTILAPYLAAALTFLILA